MAKDKAQKKDLTLDDVKLEFFARVDGLKAAKKAVKKSQGELNNLEAGVQQMGEKLAAMLQKESDRAKKLGIRYSFFNGLPGELPQIVVCKRGCELLQLCDPTDPSPMKDVIVGQSQNQTSAYQSLHQVIAPQTEAA